MSTQPTGPIAILCGINSAGEIVAVDIDTNRQIKVLTASTTVDASDVTYTPTTAADWDGGVDPGDQNNANDQLAERVKDLEIDTTTVLGACRAFWFYDTSFVVTGNAFTLAVLTTQLYNFVAYQDPASNGDVTINSCLLIAGSYTIRLIGATNINRGKVDIAFKHVNDAGYTTITTGQDWYAASSTSNVVKTATFTVVSAGRHIFKFTINGKNAASSDYILTLTKIDIYLTAGDS